MWIIRVALDRPYTFVVLALLILLVSPVMILRTPTDIFPNVNIPVIAVAWTYTGLNNRGLSVLRTYHASAEQFFPRRRSLVCRRFR
jgi:hypothetical protein